MVMETIGTLATVIAVIGVLLNNRKRRVCFVFWMISNLMTGWIHAEAGMISLMIRDIVFYILAVEGFYRWSFKEGLNA